MNIFLKKVLYSLILLGSFSKISAEIHDIHQMKEILPYIEEGTLVVFDIDDTLMVPAQMLGGDRWFRASLKKLQEEGYTFEEGLAKVLPEYMELQNKTDVLLIEDTTPALIHQIQKGGNTVIGLTTRSTELAYRTIQQLKTLDIDLNKNPIKHKHLEISTDFPFFYIQGILFTQLRHKGEALKELCDRMDYIPEKVIFVNDKLKYVQQLGETFERIGIPYIGFRYGACDEDYELYRHEVAQLQHHYFENLLSNEDAESLLNFEEELKYAI